MFSCIAANCIDRENMIRLQLEETVKAGKSWTTSPRNRIT